jgi:hypothetical protein
MRATATAPQRPAPVLQQELFGPPLLPGLSYADAIVDAAEERALIARIEASALTPFQFQQWEGKRLTRSFGWTYDFQTGRFAPGEAMPRWLAPVRERAAAFAGLCADTLEQALLIHYGVGRRHRLAQGSSGLRACHRDIAWYVGNDALPAAERQPVRASDCRYGTAIDLSYAKRGPRRMGT